METRELTPPPPFGDVVLRTPPNWTAVGFFAMLALLHFVMATISFMKGRWEGYMSVIFGVLFVLITLGSLVFRFELAVLGSRRQIRLRHGIGARFCFERLVAFKDIIGVRLTFLPGRRGHDARIELLCRDCDDIECPPTTIPRQEALYLAMALDVPLQKVSEGAFPEAPPSRDGMPSERVR